MIILQLWHNHIVSIMTPSLFASKKIRIWGALTTGIFVALAYPPYSFALLWWIMLVPLFLALREAKSGKESFWMAFFSGAVFFTIKFRWFADILPLDWAGVESKALSVGFISVVWAGSVLVMALTWGIFGVLFFRLRRERHIFDSILGASLWVIAEYLHAWLFGILWYEKSALLGPHWTFGDVGYVFHAIPSFLQHASIGGIYGLSFIIVFVNLLFSESIRALISKNLRETMIVASTFAITVLLLFISGRWMLSSEHSRQPPYRLAAVVQTAFPSVSKLDPKDYEKRFETLVALLQNVSGEKPDVIVFPEASEFLGKLVNRAGSGEEVRMSLDALLKGERTLLIDNGTGSGEKNTEERFSRVVYIDSREGPFATYDKNFLMPGGEYVSNIIGVPAQILGLDDYAESFRTWRSFTPGTETPTPVRTRIGYVATLVCSETITPEFTRKLAGDGVEILFSVSSNGVFHGSKTYAEQMIAITKVRSAEIRRSIAQATNMGYSFATSPSGEIVKRTTTLGNTVLTIPLQMREEKTIYTRAGNWVLYVAGLFAGFTWISKKKPQVAKRVLQKVLRQQAEKI